MKLLEIKKGKTLNEAGISSIKSYLQAIVKIQPKLPSELKTTPAKLMLDHGQAFPIDENTYKGKREKPHECYRNAARKAWSGTDLTYVEGYVTVHGVPLEHAWLVNKEGVVIDPTLKPHESHAYFGIPIKESYLTQHLVKSGTYGVLSFETNIDLYKTGNVGALKEKL